MKILQTSRYIAAIAGVFALLTSIGAAFLGSYLHHGGYIALSCFAAGLTLACALWWRESKHEARSLLTHLTAFSFAMTAGLALYANVVWALWSAGVPVDIGTVRDGRMGEYYWLGPFTLVYAVFCYIILILDNKQNK